MRLDDFQLRSRVRSFGPSNAQRNEECLRAALRLNIEGIVGIKLLDGSSKKFGSRNVPRELRTVSSNATALQLNPTVS
jgi:hypothetical protein